MNIKDMNIEKSAISIEIEDSKFNAFLTDLPELKISSESLDEAIELIQKVQNELILAKDDAYIKSYKTPQPPDYEELKEYFDTHSTDVNLYKYR